MGMSTERPAVLIVGHGSRHAEANAAFESLVAAYRRRHREWQIEFGYVELAEPSLLDALRHRCRSGASSIALLPLFLFRAGHVKDDVPEAIAEVRSEFPDIEFRAADALGVHPSMREIMLERATACGLEVPAPEPGGCGCVPIDACKNTAIVVIGRGSSDPDANSDFCKLVRLFAEQSGLAWVLPCFTAITGPSIEDALELISRLRPQRLIVLPYYLFNGVLLARIRDKVGRFAAAQPWLDVRIAEPIHFDDRLLSLMDERLEDALSGPGPLPCVNCKHRLLPLEEIGR